MHMQKEAQISCQVIAQLVWAFVLTGTIPLLPKLEISSLWPSSIAVQPGWCQTWLERPNVILMTCQLLTLLLQNSDYHSILLKNLSSFMR